MAVLVDLPDELQLVERVAVLVGHGLPAAGVLLGELGDVLGDRVEEVGVVLPVAQQVRHDLVAVRAVRRVGARRDGDLLGARGAEPGLPVVRDVQRLLGVGRGGQGEAEVLLDALDGGAAGRAVRVVPALRHRAVLGHEVGRVLAAVEGGGEPGVLVVVVQDVLEVLELLVGGLAAEAHDVGRGLGLLLRDAADRVGVERGPVAAGVVAEGPGGVLVGLGGAVDRGADGLGGGLGLGLPALGVLGVPLVLLGRGRGPVHRALAVDGEAGGGGVPHGGVEVRLRGRELVVGVAEGLGDGRRLLEGGVDLVAGPGEFGGGEAGRVAVPAGLLDGADDLVLHPLGEVPLADQVLEVARRRVEAAEIDLLELTERHHDRRCFPARAVVRTWRSAARTRRGRPSRSARSPGRWSGGWCRCRRRCPAGRWTGWSTSPRTPGAPCRGPSP